MSLLIRSAACAALVCLAATDLPLAQEGTDDGPSSANGRIVYLRVGCDACHGTVGHGGAAPRLAPDVLPLPALSEWVRNGTPGWSIARGMPGFPEWAVTDQELEEIFAYLSSIPAPPSADELPLLDLEPF